jgi:DNA-binding NtrC family response regulator
MKKLLIVDDEEDIRSFLKEFFELKGYSVETASCSEKAMAKFEAYEPHVVLLDIKMKNQRDGIEILRWIKQQNLKAKIIMVTCNETREIMDETTRLGADGFIVKPLSLEYLEECVTKKIESRADFSIK